MLKVLLIFLGAGCGGVARYALSEAVEAAVASDFPFGTLAVNVIGCLAVGFLAVSLEATLVREEYRLAILVGVLGGFTTFSAYSRETIELAMDRGWLLAGANVLLSNALCLAGAWIGFRLATRLHAP